MKFAKYISKNDYDKQCHKLQCVNPDTITFPPHKGETIPAKVVDVYDGDTVTVIILINGSSKAPFKIKIRIEGIDAPEIRTLNSREKEAGYKVKEYVKNLIEGKIIDLSIIKWDKFGGRIVGDIHLKNYETTLSQHLLDKGLVKYYDGKVAKSKWTESDLNNIIES